ncbi:hypothetical protein SPRG_00196 [Saprolegnia parasitica CBS 223.65]|uniref:Uncharacterized protein n=1 Tax=Saprolegnia parasitica (strain CBS 223.65) TaxID=695850 RepID=A0A067D8L5_SAPPC|nr:hypothetical protein SPRG_00196 [Saprolegnia parasitica CBS 223.65]KDO35347.1 hypothetical protein SPRG_00196 [Saprolegnia parasitica CBS 223.65]|eukprot:XP_012193693.1 hypothetical protein SPRG_00196 [Saprolegnia parasitica CBS 223.65]
MEEALARELAECIRNPDLQQRLLYQWRTAHAVLLRLPSTALVGSTPAPASDHALALSHTFASAFVATLLRLQDDKTRTLPKPIPQSLKDAFCEKCCALLLPGVSATVRVVHQTHAAPLNLQLARAHAAAQRKAKHLHKPSISARLVRVRNAVISTCHRCKHANVRAGAAKAARGLFGKLPSRRGSSSTGIKEEEKAAAAPSALDSFLKTLRPQN